jgi:hypothetical protein
MACRHRHHTISSGWAVESWQYRQPIGHGTSPDADGFSRWRTSRAITRNG